MPHPAAAAALAVARNRAAVMEELRRLLPGITDSHKTLPFDLAALDSCLPEGGLPCGALHEIVPAPYAMPAALGFTAAILARFVYSPPPRHPPAYPPPQGGRIFFILPSYELGLHGRLYGQLYGHGLRALGLEPARLVLVEPAHRRDTLWAIEEAVRSGVPAAVAGIIDKLDLKLSQRLQLAATEAGVPLLLIRSAHNLESSAAATRWRVGTAEAARDRFGLFARPRWHLRLERARNGRPGEWVVEYDHVAHRFSLAAALADPAHARGAGQKADRESHCA
jgi:protein ImuA